MEKKIILSLNKYWLVMSLETTKSTLLDYTPAFGIGK